MLGLANIILVPMDGSGSRYTMILEADENEDIYIAEFPIEQMRQYRESEVHGNAYRRPEKYHDLISQMINAPFVRYDRRK